MNGDSEEEEKKGIKRGLSLAHKWEVKTIHVGGSSWLNRWTAES